MKRYKFQIGVKFLALFVAGIFLFSGAVMLLWNALLPDVLGVNSITFWQALGILALSRILFGGFGNRGGWNRRSGHQWRRSMQAKWQNMTPEERDKFKAEWKNRCGPGWRSTGPDTSNTTME